METKKNETGRNKRETAIFVGRNKRETGGNKRETGRNKHETGRNKRETGRNKHEIGRNKREAGRNKCGTGAYAQGLTADSLCKIIIIIIAMAALGFKLKNPFRNIFLI